MADKNIKITIRDRRAIVEGSPVIVCGNSGYTLTFTFDDEWEQAGAKTARFVYVKDGEVHHEDIVFTGIVADVPVLSNVAFVKVGVFAGDLQTTTPARINCEQSILCGSGKVEEPTPDVYNQIMALLNDMTVNGGNGATEAQMKRVADNEAAIQDLKTGTTPAGDSNKLGGQLPAYYATAQSVTDIENGTKQVGKAKEADSAGDSNKLGGKGASEYATYEFETVNNTSILTLAVNLPVQTMRVYKIGGGNYTGGDLPADYYKYSDAICFKHDGNTATVVLTGYASRDDSKRIAVCHYAGDTWGEWETLATTADLANYLPKTGGTLSNTLYTPLNLENTKADINTLGFNGVSGVLGYLGFNAKNPVYRDTANTYYNLLHSGNYSDYALPKTGGHVTTTDDVIFRLNTTKTTNTLALIQFLKNSERYGYLGFNGSGNPVYGAPSDSPAWYTLHHDGNSAKVVPTNVDPGVGASVTYADNTVIFVYEEA